MSVLQKHLQAILKAATADDHDEECLNYLSRTMVSNPQGNPVHGPEILHRILCINSVVRKWIEDAFVKHNGPSVPKEVRDIIEGKKPKIGIPLFRRNTFVNVVERPPTTINNGA